MLEHKEILEWGDPSPTGYVMTGGRLGPLRRSVFAPRWAGCRQWGGTALGTAPVWDRARLRFSNRLMDESSEPESRPGRKK